MIEFKALNDSEWGLKSSFSPQKTDPAGMNIKIKVPSTLRRKNNALNIFRSRYAGGI